MQATSKNLKKQTLLAIGFLVLGLFMLTAEDKRLGTIVLMFSMVWLIVTRVRIWWHHG